MYIQNRTKVYCEAENRTLQTTASHAHKIPYWRVCGLRQWYSLNDSGTPPARLSNTPEPENQDMACRPTFEGEALWIPGEPSAECSVHQ